MGCFDNIEAFREEKRYLRKDNTLGIRNVYSNVWKNYVNLYGVQTNYYRHGYNLDTQDDYLYGEDPTESFYNPEIINMIVEYQSDAILLSKFGIQSTADLNGVIVVEDFENKFGFNIEPKAGDIIELTEAAWYVQEMNPSYSNIIQYFNIVTSNLSGYSIISDLSGIDISATKLAPAKAVVYEDELSYFLPMYIPETEIDISSYPISQDLIEVTGSIQSSNYLKLNIGGEFYLTPLYIPSIAIIAPAINALYFQNDIVDLNDEDVTLSGYFPFDYQGQQLLLPVYKYSNIDPISATVVISADSLEYYKFSTKELLCMYKDAGYVSSLLIPLSAIYGSRFIRCPQLFEITEVKYQDFAQQGLNFAQGHYVWFFHAKRFDYSFEPGLSSVFEAQCIEEQQVYDNSFSGIVTASYAPSSDEKVYNQNLEDASDEIWDYQNKGTNTNPYGYY